MWARRIHEHRDTSDARSSFFDLLLGLVSVSKNVSAISAALAPPRGSGRARARRPPEALHTFDALVLGLVSFTRAFSAHVEAMTPKTPVTEEVAPERPCAAPRDLLL